MRDAGAVEVIASGRRLAIEDSSGAGAARREAASLLGTLDLDEAARGAVALVVTEVATNLHKHAQGGEILLMPSAGAAGAAFDIVAIDRGPGMRNLEACLRDGHSTAGSPGTGLGAIRRMAGAFAIHSDPTGTLLWGRIGGSGDPEVGGVCIPIDGEESCGDRWIVRREGGRLLAMLVDGLGHGVGAERAALEALRVFRDPGRRSPAETMQRVDGALRATRGAAAAVASLDPSGGPLDYCGVGNVSGAIVDGGHTRHMVSHNGTLGHLAPRIQEFQYNCPAGATVIMHSDGIGTRWDLAQFPWSHAAHPMLVAAAIYRDARRGRDDASVLVIRCAA